VGQDIFNPNRLVSYGKRGLGMGLSSLSGFQKFIIRGNVVDMAVGIVIGAAFNGLVQAFVDDIIQPLIALPFGSKGITSFNNVSYHGFEYGKLFGVFLSFLITAAVVYYLVVRPIAFARERYDSLHHKDEEPITRECPYCMSAVNVKATRCAYCTSPLPPVNGPAAGSTAARHQ
jgi:Large-conductance mechanosensitive channel